MRAARLRHQESPEGRDDHRDHQRAFRERRRLASSLVREEPPVFVRGDPAAEFDLGAGVVLSSASSRAAGAADDGSTVAARIGRLVMDHPSETRVETDMLSDVSPSAFNAPDEKETKGEQLFSWRPQAPRCRFCGRESVFLDCG
jgi:hypothetical protein